MSATQGVRGVFAGIAIALAAASLSACTTPEPSATAAPAAKAFGQQNVVYDAGRWHLYFPSQAEYPDGNGAAVVLWVDGQNLAVEVISGNTFWTLRQNASVAVDVRRGASATYAPMHAMPLGSATATHQVEVGTMQAAEAILTPGNVQTAVISNGSRHTRIAVGLDAILLRLSPDPVSGGGTPKLWIEPDRGTVYFTDGAGGTHTFP